MTFGTITQEDREKGKQARLLKKQWALENLILDYEDEPSWQTQVDRKTPFCAFEIVNVQARSVRTFKARLEPGAIDELRVSPRGREHASPLVLAHIQNRVRGPRDHIPHSPAGRDRTRHLNPKRLERRHRIGRAAILRLSLCK